MNVLRKTRKEFFKSNRIGRYLLYGLGEIVLVVIGILIALYLDNQNEIQNENQRFNKVLQTIQSDLKSDLKELASIIPEYEQLDSTLIEVITTDYSREYINSINPENIADCEACRPLHAQFIPFRPKSDGYMMLKSIDELHSEAQNDISTKVLLFYKESIEEMVISERILSELASRNLYDLETYDWYIPCLRGNYNRDAIEYLLGSVKYKNKIASFQIIAIGNYLSRLKTYRKKGEALMKKIKS